MYSSPGNKLGQDIKCCDLEVTFSDGLCIIKLSSLVMSYGVVHIVQGEKAVLHFHGVVVQMV